MANAFKTLLELISNGDPVDAATINNILSELSGNTGYVKNLFEAAALGETVFARGESVEAAALVGQPVYYDAAQQQWKQGKADSTTDPDGTIRLADSARVWGIVHTKTNDTLADILLIGFTELDLSNAIDGTVTSGQYFLSATAGKLVKQNPGIGVPVLQVAGPGAVAGTWSVFVKTSVMDVFNHHRHYNFDLQVQPAGLASFSGGVWTIATPDTAVEGWLPANHASFNGKAPAGAKFGYNLAVSPLNNYWPPLPVEGSYLEWNQGDDVGHLGMGVPLGDDGLAIINADGIWWMSDCENEVPWDQPTTTTTTTTTTTPGP